MQGTDGSETQVTWPSNPVGVGSRGHKPLPNKRARRSPTPNPPDPPAILQPPQPHVTQANLQMSQPHHQAPQPSHTGSQPHLLAPLRNRSGPQPNLTAAQPDFQASQVPPAIGSQPTQSRPAAATALSLQTGVVLPGQVNSSLQQPSSQQQAAAFSAAAPEAQPAPYKPVQAPRLVDDTSLQPVLQHNPASNTQVLGPQHTSAHPMLHAQAPLGSTSADQLASLHSSARPLSQDSAAPTAALSSHSAQGLTTAQQQVAGTAQHMTAAAEAAVPLDARAETAAAPQSHQALTASMPSPQPASQAVATLPAPLASVQANNSPGVVAAMSGSAIGARSEGEGLSHSEAGQKRELGEMGDMSAEQQQDRDLLGTSVARQQAPAVQDVPVPKRARLEERFTGVCYLCSQSTA